MSDPRVVVVGGGLAGIAAALSCSDGGASITLLESSPRLGGAASSFRRDGLSVDTGQHVFLRCCTAYRWFLARVGADGVTTIQDRLDIPVLSPARAPTRLRRTRLPAPLHLAGALASYRLLSRRERVAAGIASVALRRLDESDESIDARTFEEWLLEHRQSRTAIQHLWNLIALPTLNLPASEASLQLAAKVFKTGLLTDSAAGDIGYACVALEDIHGERPRRLLEDAGGTVRVKSPVDGIEATSRGFLVHSNGDAVGADAVIVAVPHDRVAELLPQGTLANQDSVADLGFSPIVNVHVLYGRRVLDVPFAAALGTPVQWVFDRSRPSGWSGGQYLAISLSAADDYVEARTKELRDVFVPALKQLLPRAREARVESFFVTRERHATFRQVPGAGRLRPGPRTAIPGLYVAGAWTDTGWPATMEGAVRSGLHAARHALRGLGRRSAVPTEVAA